MWKDTTVYSRTDKTKTPTTFTYDNKKIRINIYI